MKSKLITLILTLLTISVIAQDVNNMPVREILNETARKNIQVPDILGYKTLKCDFHIHTVFSDGVVWPATRVDEAWQEGLDAIAITDHIEYPKKVMPKDRNMSYEIAKPRAEEKNIILIRGGEITRSMPPGHFNALFVTDLNALDTSDYMDAFQAANEQGGFIIWNHPGWKAQQPDTCKWWKLHTKLYEKGWLNGVEVFNENEWFPIALDWCIDKNLAVIGTTDIHGIVANLYNLEKYHRPMTLVFAEERSEEAIKKALFAKRTATWFGNNLAGKKEFLSAIFEKAVHIELINKTPEGKKFVISNNSDIPFILSSLKNSFTIPANGETLVTLIENEQTFTVKNLFIKGTENLVVSIPLQ